MTTWKQFLLVTRVNYDEDNWNKIIKVLKENPKSIHRTNRAQILDDSFALAKTGQLGYGTVLEMTDYLYKESDQLPWSAALGGTTAFPS